MEPLSELPHSHDSSSPPRVSYTPRWEDVDLFLAGKASPEDSAGIEAWLQTSPKVQVLFLEHRQAVTNMLPHPTVEEAMATLQSVRHRIAVSPALAESRTSSVRRNGRTGYRRWWGAAAVVCAAAAIVLTQVPIETSLLRATLHENSLRTVVTAPGQQARFHLPDGTSVMLAPGSALRYEKTFGDEQREVHLDGEALFTVTHRAGAPFTVQVSNRSVQVLGTTFTVRHYADDTATRVVVAEGRVAAENTVLGIGDAAIIDSLRRTTVEHGIDIASALAWTSGRLVFDRAPLHEVLPELSRWYGMTITATDRKLMNARVTTTLDSQNPQEGLDILAALVQADIVRTANGIQLRPK